MSRMCNATLPNAVDFEKVSREYGIWADTRFPDDALSVFDGVRNSRQQLLDAVCGRTFTNYAPIYYGHHFSLELNAIAFTHASGCFIGVNVGTYNVLRSVFLRLLASPFFFPNIGNAAGEDATLPQTNLLGWSLTESHVLQNLNCRPKCPIRSGCVELFMEFAFDFILLHELGHISRGHLGLIHELTGVDMYAELNGQGRSIDNDTSQALELDADGFAMSSLFFSVLTMSERYLEARSEWQPALKDPMIALVVAAVSMYTVFRLFSHEQQLDLNDLTGGTHPHPMLRMFRLGIYLETVLEHYSPRFEVKDPHFLIPKAAHKIVEESIQHVTISDRPFELKEIDDTRVFRRLDDLDRKLQKDLRLKMSKHRWTQIDTV